MDYGKVIKLARIATDTSQRELAKLVGKTPGYICLLEKGKRNPSLRTLEKISKALKVSMYLIIQIAELSPYELSVVGLSLQSGKKQLTKEYATDVLLDKFKSLKTAKCSNL